MSGLRMWAPWFLFLWQLLRLQVQAAPIPELAMDSILLTSIPLGPSKPWSWDHQSPGNIELPLLNQAVLTESPAPNPQEALLSFHPNKKPQLTLHSIIKELSSTSRASSQYTNFVNPWEGSTSTSKSSVDVDVQPSHQKATDSNWGEGQHQLLPIDVKDVDLGVLINSQPPKKIAPSASSKVSEHHAKSTKEEQPTSQQESPALSTSEADATALKQTAAPPLNAEVIFPRPEPIQAQQPTFPPLELEVPIIQEPTLEAGATALKPNKCSSCKAPYETVQAHQPTFPPLDLELTITPESTLEADAALQQTAAPAKHPEVTLPPPEPVQAQQPTFPPFDLELTITPEPTSEADATALQQTIAPPKHPEVTLQHPELVQVQQPSFSEVTATVLSFDLEVTIIQQPESSETVPPMTEQNATMNICELCSCNNGTLSCIGFGSNQRLHRVPVPEPSTYNGTFPILNLQGNASSYIAVKYLDMGTTQVTFTTLDNILMTTPELEKLILPKHLACCLCQSKRQSNCIVTNTPWDENS
ncbi:hypothetical protein QTO34_009263 [Cnephaeus nilssonii]|uniref:Leucine-rich repeat-containing protein 37 N-terminal domain-containing protein n=1 Tax=Cnephaeus nilssonii TaxID=3371016 RepID=A0AA40HIH9_CNENI|nr:hypothetical protein QTO34_009263 [Eptesicus nilssonii]